MKAPNEDGKPTDNMESLRQQASACGAGCGCHASGASGKTRWVIGAVVLVAAGALAVRAVIRSDTGTTQSAAPEFAGLTASVTPAKDGIPSAESAVADPAVAKSVGTSIGALAELNTMAAKTDAVFVYLPGKEGTPGNPPSTPMNGAVRLIEAQGKKCALFTLKAGTQDYNQIAAQMSVPGVLAMVKGRSMSAVSGEITESKLVQGFVAASSAGACGPSAGAGCCPK